MTPAIPVLATALDAGEPVTAVGDGDGVRVTDDEEEDDVSVVLLVVGDGWDVEEELDPPTAAVLLTAVVEDGVSSLDDGEGGSLWVLAISVVLVAGATVGVAEVGDGSSLVVGGGGASVVGISLVGTEMVTSKGLLVVLGGIAWIEVWVLDGACDVDKMGRLDTWVCGALLVTCGCAEAAVALQ
jgi:hypothetical protein